MSAAAGPRLKPEDVIAEPTTAVEKAKKLAARRAVDEFVKTGMNIGVGSGSTIVYAVQRLAERARDEGLVVKCVPTSFQSRQVRAQRPATAPEFCGGRSAWCQPPHATSPTPCACS